MLMYRLRRLLWGALLLLPLQAMALNLGDLVVRSMPGEPFRAHIPIQLEANETLTQIRVTLADSGEYERRRLARSPLLDKLALALLDKGEGKGRIQLFSDESWQGESADILLQLRWPDGELEQQFTLAALNTDEGSTPVYVEIGANERLDAIAMRLSKGRNRSYLHMMYTLFMLNPDAFYRGNINNLKGGVTLRVPTNEELYRYSDKEVYDGLREQNQAWEQRREKQAAEKASTEAMEQRLQQVVEESDAIREQNEALRERLKQLEQRMQSVAGRVLDYAEEDAPTETAEEVVTEEKTSQESVQTDDTKVKVGESLSGTSLLSAIVLALLFAFYIWYSTGHKHRGRE